METPEQKNDIVGPRKKSAYQKILLLALALSIVLNIAALLAIKRFIAFAPVVLRPLITAKEYNPSWLLTLAETPESARREKPPDRAEHISDKNAAAQNRAAPPDLPLGAPFANGALREADAAPRPEIRPNESKESSKRQTTSDDAVPSRIETIRPNNGASSNFRREFLTGESANPPWPYVSRYEPGLANSNSRAPELGSFSLNTYAWEYAPYLLWLKNRVQRNIYPPPAFTHMGMISGQTILRFRINRDGTLQNFELLGYEGHKSLMETSVRAIQLSAPFRALPHDFPEEYLEITARFDYIINR